MTAATPSRRHRALVVCGALASVAASAPARAGADETPTSAQTPTATKTEPPKPKPEKRSKLRWDSERPRFRPIEYVLTGIVGPLAIAEYFYLPAQQQAHWVGGVLFDDAVRDALRLRTASAQKASWAMADTVGVTLVGITVGLDSVIVPLVQGSFDVALQLTLMDAEAFSFSSILAISLYDTVGRARPSYEDCLKDPSAPTCYGTSFASFPSGHINEAFTAAGLSCAHHLFAHVYQSKIADAFACARDLTLATTEGLLRIMGDRHWTSDVIAGSAIGFGFGFGLSSLLHYVKWNHRSPVKTVTLAPMMGSQLGVLAMGSF